MQRPRPKRIRRPLISSVRCVSGLAVACVLAGCSRGSASTDEASRLAAALESVPGVAPRLSIPTAFRRCSEQAPPEGTITRADCPPRRSSRRPLVALARALPAGDDAAALHTRAIVDMVVPDERGISLDRAITSLRRLEAMADRPAPVLADLSAALIVRAERTQAPRDLLEAYEIAERALKHDPRNVAALYNRALALDRFGLVDETARDWQAYLAADSTSDWADDAQRRRRALLAIQPPPHPAPDAPLTEYARYAAADPQGARELGMDHLLGEWGAAVEVGDGPRAADRLARAATLGEALEHRPGGDASLADAVRAIRAAETNVATLRLLAQAHREYGAGRREFENLNRQAAEQRFAAAEAASSASPALHGWVRVHVGITHLQRWARDQGEPLLMEAARANARYPALAARALWVLGRTYGRRESWERGLDYAHRSARLFAQAGERENEGAALVIVTDIRFVVGETDSAYTALHRALGRLRPYRSSVRLHNLLLAGAEESAADGQLAAAIRLQDEGVNVTARNGDPLPSAEATLTRAQLLLAAGLMRRSVSDLDTVRRLVPQVADSLDRVWLEVNLREAEAVVSVAENPARAAEVFDSAAAFYTSIPLPFRTLPALVRGAGARLTAGDAAGATQRLEAAVRLLDQRRDSLRVEPRRAAVFDAARDVIDRVVMLKVADGRTAEALEYMDRSRASLASSGARTVERANTLRAPPGAIAVEYARVADTLLIWTLTGERVEVSRSVLDTVRFTRTVEALHGSLEGGAQSTEIRPALALLYDWLVRPVEERLGAAETQLVIVADGEIAAVPFAALYDTRRSRHLIEDHPLRFGISLREALRPAGAGVSDSVLLVSDPAFSAREHPLLNRLPHARQEARAVAGAYPAPEILEYEGATRGKIETALLRAGIVHFAGHAVFDDRRPERSYLVVASGTGTQETGTITAAELAGLDLTHVQLVVLSACRTMRAGRSRAGGFSGLSGALLAAGATGTIGSLWDVDDQATAALMADFHRAYHTGRNAPAALRSSQLAALRSGDAGLRTPAAWAAFRYVGR
jgi:CHAT domain-containing protein